MDHTLACPHPLVDRTGTKKWGESGDSTHRDFTPVHISIQVQLYYSVQKLVYNFSTNKGAIKESRPNWRMITGALWLCLTLTL